MTHNIAFCTVVKNRAYHLKQTLLKNIEDNADFQQCVFLVLDYNSEDDLEDWVKNYCKNHIETGKLVYFKTFGPEAFHRSHSRNLIFKLAEADIICNIDADNFLGKGFAKNIEQSFSNTPNSFMALNYLFMDLHFYNGAAGRICVKKKDFLRVNGFDESMSGYGYEDLDLIGRLENLNLQKKSISNPVFLQTIAHEDELRISNESLYKHIHLILVHYKSCKISQLFFLSNDGKCQFGEMIDLYYLNMELKETTYAEPPEYTLDLSQDDWMTGKWQQDTQDEYKISLSNGEELNITSLSSDPNIYAHQANGQKLYYAITDPPTINSLLKFNTEIKNRKKMEKNIVQHTKINEEGFGHDTVFKNFNYDKSINV